MDTGKNPLSELTAAEQAFVEEHLSDDVSHLALSLAHTADLRSQLVLRQIEGLQTLQRKIPSLAAVKGLMLPPRLSMEQCSGEAAALYKRRLVERILPHAASMADLTGGFGVDFSFMAPLFKKAFYVERQAELVALARHNMPLLGIGNDEFLETEAEAAISEMPPLDMIFLDPARRDGSGRKVVMLADCSPDVEQLMPALLAKARCVLIKLSPMLDLHAAVASLAAVSEVHIVADRGEVKELLLLATSDAPQQPRIFCADGGMSFSFMLDEEAAAEPLQATAVGKYLYEPHAALLKAGAFKLPTARFSVQKLHPNSHLYTSDTLHEDFPGRIFRVEKTYDFSRSGIRDFIADFGSGKTQGRAQANVAVRNFPLTAVELRNRLHLSDGGSRYVFGTTLSPARRFVILASKV